MIAPAVILSSVVCSRVQTLAKLELMLACMMAGVMSAFVYRYVGVQSTSLRFGSTATVALSLTGVALD